MKTQQQGIASAIQDYNRQAKAVKLSRKIAHRNNNPKLVIPGIQALGYYKEQLRKSLLGVN